MHASSYGTEYDDLLTLQINNDHGGVTVEMSGPPAPPPPPPAASISTQTSFQSVTELLNCLSSGCDKVAQAANTPTPTTEDIFSAMAKKFASELPCTSRTPAHQPLNNFNKYDLVNAASTSRAAAEVAASAASLSSAAGAAVTSPTRSTSFYAKCCKKKDSPRKHAAVSCVDRNQKTHSNFSNFTASTPTTEDAIETRPVLYSAHENFKYIDELDDDQLGGDVGESTSVVAAPPLTRSPSLFVYKQSVVGNPCAEFTNIRNPGDFNAQRRLTLKVLNVME